jgi:hypothetical protein
MSAIPPKADIHLRQLDVRFALQLPEKSSDARLTFRIVLSKRH